MYIILCEILLKHNNIFLKEKNVSRTTTKCNKTITLYIIKKGKAINLQKLKVI